MFGMGATSAPLQVLQPQPSFEELQRVAAQVQQLLLAGHRLEALRQAHNIPLPITYHCYGIGLAWLGLEFNSKVLRHWPMNHANIGLDIDRPVGGGTPMLSHRFCWDVIEHVMA